MMIFHMIMFTVLVNSLNSTCTESIIQKIQCMKVELFKIIFTTNCSSTFDKNIRIHWKTYLACETCKLVEKVKIES